MTNREHSIQVDARLGSLVLFALFRRPLPRENVNSIIPLTVQYCQGSAPWHLWFAWHPVRTNYHGWRWLRHVYRRQRWTPADIPGGPQAYWEYGLE